MVNTLHISDISFLMFKVSCSVIRGYLADGTSGSGIYSVEHHDHDTVSNGNMVFSFPVDKDMAAVIDTLHFFTVQPYCEKMTLSEAVEGKSENQGVMVIWNDTIDYERYWGDVTPDRLLTVFSVSISITSLMCGIAIDDGYIHNVGLEILFQPESVFRCGKTISSQSYFYIR